MDIAKKNAAIAAMEYVTGHKLIGVGTGSTANFFIEELAKIKHDIDGAVASSNVTEQKLQEAGIPVLELNQVTSLPIYVDGADSFNNLKQLVKGGGGALTREKIVRAASEKFICIVDETKQPSVLGSFPIPVEVIPMARSLVAREIVKICSGQPRLRENFTTDNGNIILDIYNLKLNEPIEFEEKLNNIPGVVTNGLFARQGADVIIVGNETSAKII